MERDLRATGLRRFLLWRDSDGPRRDRYHEVRRRTLPCRFFLAVALHVCFQFSGCFLIFRQEGAVNERFAVFPLVKEGSFLVSIVLTCWFVDASVGGRRILLVISLLVTCPALILAVDCGLVEGGSIFESNPSNHGCSLSWFSWPALFLWYAGFQMGLATAGTWVYTAEIFTWCERGVALPLVLAARHSSGMLEKMVEVNHGGAAQEDPSKMGPLLFIYSNVNVLILIFVLHCIKETRGVPTVKIPGLFGAEEMRSQTVLPPFLTVSFRSQQQSASSLSLNPHRARSRTASAPAHGRTVSRLSVPVPEGPRISGEFSESRHSRQSQQSRHSRRHLESLDEGRRGGELELVAPEEQ